MRLGGADKGGPLTSVEKLARQRRFSRTYRGWVEERCVEVGDCEFGESRHFVRFAPPRAPLWPYLLWGLLLNAMLGESCKAWN